MCIHRWLAAAYFAHGDDGVEEADEAHEEEDGYEAPLAGGAEDEEFYPAEAVEGTGVEFMVELEVSEQGEAEADDGEEGGPDDGGPGGSVFIMTGGGRHGVGGLDRKIQKKSFCRWAKAFSICLIWLCNYLDGDGCFLLLAGGVQCFEQCFF